MSDSEISRPNGHCTDDKVWQDFAARYGSTTREQLCGGDRSDFQVAYETAMIGRNDLDHEAKLITAKDRIRWLSVQLAKARADLASAPPAQPLTDISQELERLREALDSLIADKPANDPVYYLGSVLSMLRHLHKEVTHGPTVGGEALADNIDWLDCYIDQIERTRSSLKGA